MQNIQLVIFDCDGVLVDSEYLAARIESKLLTDAGYPIDVATMSERYSGMSWKSILLDVEKDSPVPLSASLFEQAEKLVDMALERELDIIEGVSQTVQKIKYPKCICSNSSSERLGISLGRVGLHRVFAPYIFAAHEVGNKKGKPDPNVFQFAAKRFNALPQKTVVIEDSVHGVSAAAAAGMRVIGFTGGAHSYDGHADKLIDAGAETAVARFIEIPAVIEAFAVWAGPDAA